MLVHWYVTVDSSDVDIYLFLSEEASPKNASYYGNRAATLMMLCRFREALADSQQAVRLDDCFMKVSVNRLSRWSIIFIPGFERY